MSWLRSRCWARSGRAVPWCAAMLLVACSKSPAAPDKTGAVPATPALVSSPFAPTPDSAAATTSGDAYVSLVPESIPGGIHVTIMNLRSATTVGGPMPDGGFDPIAIAAQTGDTVEVRVARDRGDTTIGYSPVPASSVPQIVRISPANRKTDISINDVIVVVFSEPMIAASLIGAIHVTIGGVAVAGTVVPASGPTLSAVFQTVKGLSPNTTYTIDVSTEATAQNGLMLPASVQTSFTTAGGPAVGAACVHDCWIGHSSMTGTGSSWGAGVVNGIIYNVRGLSGPGTVLEAYNPATDSWTVEAPIPTARYAPGVGVLNGLIYVIGGDTTAVEAYDPASNMWTPKSSLPVTVRYPGVAVIGNLLYVLSMDGALEVYDPVADRWTARSPVPGGGVLNLVAAVNGTLYAIGGTNQCCSNVGSTLNAYDPATDTWTGRAVLSNLRQPWGVGVLNGLVYVLGGVDPYDPVNAFQVYDPSTNIWTAKTVPPQALNWVVGVVVINAQLYAIADANESYRP
jgi:hypothetical protein